jgi:hypothetical protein
MSRDSSVGIATGYGLDCAGFGRSKKLFPYSRVSNPALEATQLSIQWITEALSLGVKL